MMQHAMKVLAGGLVWIALAACFGSADPLPGPGHDHSMSQQKSQDDNNIQMSLEPQMVKRAWRQMPQGGWGKRAWHNMPSSGWGKRADPYSWMGNGDKRTWQKFQGGWGKRSWTSDDDSQLYESENEPQYDEYSTVPAEFDDLMDEEKRTWRSLTPSWGKRATDWESFRGSWGKRDPAWNNLKGLWGKRSMQDRISS